MNLLLQSQTTKTKIHMDYNSLRKTTIKTDPSFVVEGQACVYDDGEWYLNEEHVYIDSSDDAVSLLEQKAKSIQQRLTSLVTENFTTDQAIKAIRKYNSKVSESVLEQCIEAASSKELTNKKEVLELRRHDSFTLADKYLFVLDNKEIIALSEDEVSILESMDDELIGYAKQKADNLKHILREFANV